MELGCWPTWPTEGKPWAGQGMVKARQGRGSSWTWCRQVHCQLGWAEEDEGAAQNELSPLFPWAAHAQWPFLLCCR